MQNHFLGERIRQRRNDLQLTREQLCDGICSPSTLYRLERGESIPHRQVLDALLERLDMSLDSNIDQYAYLREEITAHCIEYQKALDAAEKQKCRECALDAISRLEASLWPNDILNRQFIQRTRIILNEANLTPAQQRTEILKTLRMTSPHFDGDHIANGLYTTDEIKLINLLAVSYSEEGCSMDAIHILRQLYEYIPQRYQNVPLTKAHFQMVAYNYARELVLVRQYQSAILVAQKGIDIGLAYGNYLYIGMQLGILAECHHFLGNDPLSKTLYLKAFYYSLALNDQINAECFIREARDYLNVDLLCQ